MEDNDNLSCFVNNMIADVKYYVRRGQGISNNGMLSLSQNNSVTALYGLTSCDNLYNLLWKKVCGIQPLLNMNSFSGLLLRF